MIATGYKCYKINPQRNRLSMLERMCYDIYKEDWLLNHVRDSEVKDAMAEYYGKCTRDRKFRLEYPTFDSYIEEIGYSDGIYVSKAEFCQNEFLNGDFMAELLEDYVDLYDAWCNNGELLNKIAFEADEYDYATGLLDNGISERNRFKDYDSDYEYSEK